MNAGANLTTAMRLLRQQIEQAEKRVARSFMAGESWI